MKSKNEHRLGATAPQVLGTGLACMGVFFGYYRFFGWRFPKAIDGGK